MDFKIGLQIISMKTDKQKGTNTVVAALIPAKTITIAASNTAVWIEEDSLIFFT